MRQPVCFCKVQIKVLICTDLIDRPEVMHKLAVEINFANSHCQHTCNTSYDQVCLLSSYKVTSLSQLIVKIKATGNSKLIYISNFLAVKDDFYHNIM